ncbi:MAG: hypothetical protein ABIQ11_04735 [Saprospiraceae bacterium]
MYSGEGLPFKTGDGGNSATGNKGGQGNERDRNKKEGDNTGGDGEE